MQKKLNNILIIGLGMMGGSLCRSIKKNKVSNKITAFDVNHKSINYAIKNKIIDQGIDKFNTMDHPDLIILCTPLSAYVSNVKKLLLTIDKPTLITDIGSSKGSAHRNLIKLVNKTNKSFLSSHPMVGSEKSGIENNINDLFRDRVVFIVDKEKSDKSSFYKLKSFWESLGSVTYDIDQKKHDLLMSQTSHIAHLMSYIFMQSLPKSIINKNLPLLLGGGIKEHVRLSSSNPDMWTDIFLDNKNNIISSLNRIEKNTSNMKSMIHDMDEPKIRALLNNIHQKTK